VHTSKHILNANMSKTQCFNLGAPLQPEAVLM